MKRPIRLFVSSSPELAPEREVIGQLVAEIPIALGWEIMYTPGPGTQVQNLLEFIDTCDFYLVVLGGDFAAPMGVEWQEAVTSGRTPFAFRKDVLHTLSGRHLLTHSNVKWVKFQTAQGLKQKVKQGLVKEILDRGELFGLLLPEIDALLAELKRSDEAASFPDTPAGAGSDAVLLDRRMTASDQATDSG